MGRNINAWLGSIPRLLRPIVNPLIPRNQIDQLKQFLSQNEAFINNIHQHVFIDPGGQTDQDFKIINAKQP